MAPDGTVNVPSGLGLGFDIDHDYIEHCSETVEVLNRKNAKP